MATAMATKRKDQVAHPETQSDSELLKLVLFQMRHGWMLRLVILAGRVTMVFSPPQSGKTDFICQVVAACINSWPRKTPIVILRNFVEDGPQLQARAHEFGKKLAKLCQHGKFRFGTVRMVGTMSPVEIDRECELNGASQVMAMIGSTAQLEKLRTFMLTAYNPDKHGEIVIIVDEADQQIDEICGEEDVVSRRPLTTKSEHLLRDIMDAASSTVMISATPVMLTAAARVNQVVCLDTGMDASGRIYHSYKDHTYVPVDLDALIHRNSPRHAEALVNFDQVMNGTNMRCRRDLGRVPDESINGFLSAPGMMLINPGRSRKHHETVRDIILKRFRKPYAPTVVVHNGKNISVHECEGKSWGTSLFPACGAGNASGYTVGSVLQELVDQARTDPSRHRNVVIIAGVKAGRGISFESNDHSRKLTHGIFLGRPEAGTDIIQSFGRLCGRCDSPVTRVLIASTAMLQSYWDHSKAQEEIVGSIVRGSSDGVTGPTGFLAPIDQPEYEQLVDTSIEKLRFGSKRNQRRAGNCLSVTGPGLEVEQMEYKTLKTAMELHPQADVMDVMIELTGSLADEHLDAIHDLAYHRGPAKPGSPIKEHLALLARQRSRKGGKSRLDELCSAIGSCAGRKLAALGRSMGGDSRFAWPSTLALGKDWNGDGGTVRIMFDEFTPVDRDAALGKPGHLRNTTHRKITKSRSITSSSGDIDYLAYDAFISYENEPSTAQVPWQETWEWGQRSPNRRIGLVLRLKRDVQTVWTRSLADGTILEIDREAAKLLYKQTRHLPSSERPRVRHCIKGEYITATSSFQVLAKNGTGKLSTAFGKPTALFSIVRNRDETAQRRKREEDEDQD